MFNHRYRYLFILLLASYAFLNTVLCEVYYYFKINIEWYYAFLTIVLVTLFSWETSRLLEPLVLKKLPPDKNRIKFLAGFFVISSALTFLLTTGVVYFIGKLIHGYTWSEKWNPLKLNLIYAGLINLLFHLINAIVFFFKEYQKKQTEAEELRRTSEQARLQLIKNQVNPHFLFNNLNVLSGMVIKDNPEANHFIEEFSKVYRYILSNQQKELVELRSELEFIEPYLFLLRKRFDEGLEVKLNIAEQYKSWHVVPAALQMLIENAIKHNVVSRHKPLQIDIHTNGSQTLIIKNNLQPRQVKEPSTHIGLQNIRKRYELISHRDVIVKKTEGSFEVTLPLLNIN